MSGAGFGILTGEIPTGLLVSQMVLEYALNAAWQVPLVAGTAWLFVRAARLGALSEHRVWLGVLAVCVLLPMRGVERPVAPSVIMTPLVTTAFGDVPESAADVRLDGPVSGAFVLESAPVRPALHFASLHLRVGEMHFSERTLRLCAWLYGSVVALAMLRLGRGSLAAHRLLGNSERYAMDEAEAAMWREMGERLRGGVRLPEVRTSDRVESPVLVGVWRPVLLLPRAFSECAAGERRAALCHELAHLQRRDCLTNALCQWLGVPLVWHPAVAAVQRQIARTREMVCDAVAARQMGSAAGDGRMTYARCLLGLAQRMLGAGEPGYGSRDYSSPGLGLFKSNKLEERVMRLTEVKQAMSISKVWMRRAVGAVAMASAMGGAAMFHLRPVLAQAVDAPAGLMARNVAVQPMVPLAATMPLTLRVPANMPLALPAPVNAQEAVPVVTPVLPVTPALPPMAGPVAPLPPMATPMPPLPPMPQVAAPKPIPATRPTPAPAPAPAPMPMPAPAPTPMPAPAAMAQFNEDVAHAGHGHMMVKDGNHVHRWVGADGKVLELWNGQAAELTAQQKRDAEAEYRRETEKAQLEIAKMRKQLDSPEFKAQMKQLTDGKIQEEMARAQKQVAEQMARMQSPEWKAQMDQLTSGKIQEQMAQVQKQIAEATAKIDSPEAKAARQKQIDEAVAQVNSPEFKRQMEEVSKQASKLSSAEVKKQMLEIQRQMKEIDSPEFKRQMEQVQKQVSDAMKELQASQKDLKDQ